MSQIMAFPEFNDRKRKLPKVGEYTHEGLIYGGLVEDIHELIELRGNGMIIYHGHVNRLGEMCMGDILSCWEKGSDEYSERMRRIGLK